MMTVASFGSFDITLGGSDPFDAAASGEAFLNPFVTCVGGGDNTAADSAYTAAGLDWTTLTTDIDGTPLDTGTVDMGRHYDPADVWIKTFSATVSDANWTTNAAVSCEISNDFESSVIAVDSADLVSGTVSHGQGGTVVLTMTCQGANLPASADATVP